MYRIRHRSITAIFITFNPERSLYARVSILLERCINVVIIENGASGEWPSSPLLKIICPNKNLGLNGGLKLACTDASVQSADWIIYIDQDTVFTRESVRFMVDKLSASCFGELVAISFRPDTHEDVVSVNERAAVMGSCLASHLDLIRKTGYFSTLQFFVDFVDFEYCFNIRQSGGRVIEISGCPGLKHKSVQNPQPLKVFGVVLFYAREYQPARLAEIRLGLWKMIRKSIFYRDFAFARVMLLNLISFVLGRLFYVFRKK